MEKTNQNTKISPKYKMDEFKNLAGIILKNNLGTLSQIREDYRIIPDFAGERCSSKEEVVMALDSLDRHVRIKFFTENNDKIKDSDKLLAKAQKGFTNFFDPTLGTADEHKEIARATGKPSNYFITEYMFYNLNAIVENNALYQTHLQYWRELEGSEFMVRTTWEFLQRRKEAFGVK